MVNFSRIQEEEDRNEARSRARQDLLVFHRAQVDLLIYSLTYCYESSPCKSCFRICCVRPCLVAYRRKAMTDVTMPWRMMCGDGLFERDQRLCVQLQFATDCNDAPQVVAVQVKEKIRDVELRL